MPNANKAKGDRAERAVLDAVTEFFPSSWRTRAGWDEDRGDIVLDLLGDKVLTWAIQVKDTASVPGTPELTALADQVINGGHMAGVIWHKIRGKSDPRHWRVMMSGRQYLLLMDRLRVLEAALARESGGLG
ncbi:holliday junction resolvase [Gordonia phage Trine]|uniref:Holliday junction resolvase n=1 Tax=Gordonia phage Trine TaxID=2201431 RepID=A0A2Z4Q9J5_9CAUD|nr:holliday junction resolvase [Gordonia phage Trine]AWY06565.1 holliday junction resolvase [Gordonia phage Trine]